MRSSPASGAAVGGREGNQDYSEGRDVTVRTVFTRAHKGNSPLGPTHQLLKVLLELLRTGVNVSLCLRAQALGPP